MNGSGVYEWLVNRDDVKQEDATHRTSHLVRYASLPSDK